MSEANGQPPVESSGQAPLLAVQDLQVWYELKRWGFMHAGYVRAVDGVNFELRRGEAMACVGESGCGKSSLMKAILKLNEASGGAILFEGKRLADLKGEDLHWFRSQVGYVQQDPYGALAPFMSVQRILEEPLIVHGIKDADERLRRIEQALTEVKMTPTAEFLPKYPHMLSGGQQQRVVIARSMILDPKLLVADEPVSMLDASVRVEVLRLLRGLQESHNLAVIYITHDLSTVRYFSEFIFVMYAGQIVEMARVDDLLNHPQHPYTLALLAASVDPDANNALEMREVPPGEPPSLVHPPAGCRFHPRCPRMIPGTCDVDVPPAFVTEPEHRVACWLYEPGAGRDPAGGAWADGDADAFVIPAQVAGGGITPIVAEPLDAGGLSAVEPGQSDARPGTSSNAQPGTASDGPRSGMAGAEGSEHAPE